MIPEIFAAAEGRSLDVNGDRQASTNHPINYESAISDGSALFEPLLLLGVENSETAGMILEIARADEIQVVAASTAAELMHTATSMRPSLIIIERQFGGKDALELCDDLRSPSENVAADTPIIIVADVADFQRWECCVCDRLARLAIF